MGNILSTGTHNLRASVYPLWAILTFVTLKWPWKVIRGQMSWRSLTKSTIVNIFVIDTSGLWATVWPLLAIFTFRVLGPLEVIQSQGHCGFWILANKFLLVSLSNYGSISHRLGAIDNYSCTWPRSRTWPRKVTQGQRSRCTSTDQDIVNIFVNRHP